MDGWLVNNEMESIRKEANANSYEVLHRNLPGRSEENHSFTRVSRE
jgi:hypothetical protein